MATRQRRRVQPSMVFVIVAVLAAVIWAIASRDGPDYSRPTAATFTDEQLAPLDEAERALLRWTADSAPEWEGLALAVANFDSAAEQRDIRNLERSCRRITDAAELLEGRLPAPSANVDRLLRQALVAYATGGDACRAVARGEADKIEAMRAAFDEGDEALLQAADHFAEVECPDGTTTIGFDPC